MGFLIFVGVIWAIIYLSKQSAKATGEKWKTAVRNLNLGYYEGGIGSSGTITGERNGHQVTVSTHTNGNNSQTYTKYLMVYRESIPFFLRMTRQSALHKIGQVVGLQDIEVGNSTFDDQVVVRGSQPDAVRRFLTPKRQEAIETLVMLYPDIVISSESVIIKKTGKDTEPSLICNCIRRLESFCNEMVDIQHASSNKSYEVTQQPPAIPMREKKLPAISEMVESSVAPANAVIPAAETGIEPEMVEHVAGQVILQESVLLDEVPECVESPLPEPIEVELKQVAAELYGGNAGSSLLTSKKFEEHYKNKPVTGAGILKRVSKFNYDPIFTNCTGVIATFDIIELAGDYSKIKVAANVKFPSEEYDALKAKLEQSLLITGILVAQDSMMHQLYIADE